MGMTTVLHIELTDIILLPVVFAVFIDESVLFLLLVFIRQHRLRELK